MTTLFLTFIFFAIFIFLMALGYLFTQRPLKGSCGGLNRITGLSCLFCRQKDQCQLSVTTHTPNSGEGKGTVRPLG